LLSHRSARTSVLTSKGKCSAFSKFGSAIRANVELEAAPQESENGFSNANCSSVKVVVRVVVCSYTFVKLYRVVEQPVA
jgi:hypothetical protein